MNAPNAVVKVGGSLLDWPELPDHLAAYLETRKADRLVLVVGGGPFADALRNLDARLALGEETSHALALRVLDLTAHFLSARTPGLRVVEGWAEIARAWELGLIPVLAPRRFLESDDRTPDPLPHVWTTTTDSIAARLAQRLGAGELTLLKSAGLPEGADIGEAIRLGLLDPEFGRASAGLRTLIYRDLRAAGRAGRVLERRGDPGPSGAVWFS